MIELTDGRLCFSFPNVVAELKKLTQNYVQNTLPAILNEDRDVALDRVLAENYFFREATKEDRQNYRLIVRKISAEQITRAFEDSVKRRANLESEWGQNGEMSLDFKRTLRIPDDGNNYPLPPGLGRFPLRHVDDFADRVSASWLDRGGVMLPMYQAEALWINFSEDYPFAVKIGAGKINAVTGDEWRNGLSREPQDYLVLPEQPWLDGFAVEKGVIRQFVAMPLGAGYSVEEQITGKAEFGGIQIQVYPMKAEVYFKQTMISKLPGRFSDVLPEMLPRPTFTERTMHARQYSPACSTGMVACQEDMGLGAGGRMKQEIYMDTNDLDVWDLNNSSRCFVHLCNSAVWREITGTNPPQPPVTAKEYERYGLPWFDFYRDDLSVLEGSGKLAAVKSVAALSVEKGDHAVIGNDPVKVGKTTDCGPGKRPNQVREWLDRANS